MQAPIKASMDSREWLMLLALSVLWGGSFFFVEVSLRQLPPLTIVLLRVSLAATALWIFAALIGQRVPSNPNIWRAFFTMGLINNVLPFGLLVWGQTHITSGLAAILNATTPMFTIVIASFLLSDERLNLAKLAGVGAGIAGVALMIGPQVLQGMSGNLLAQAAVLGAALSYAFAGIYGRRFKTLGVAPVVAAAGQVSASALILLPAVLLFEPGALAHWPEREIIGAILALGILSTALAYVLYFRILASAGATNLLLVTLLIPVSAILLGSLILGEKLAAVHFIGMAFIAAGLLAIDGRIVGRLRAKISTPNRG